MAEDGDCVSVHFVLKYQEELFLLPTGKSG